MELSFHEDLIVLALFPGLLAFHLQFSITYSLPIKNWMSGNKARLDHALHNVCIQTHCTASTRLLS